jgi:galactose mutarotase-like enzyme
MWLDNGLIGVEVAPERGAEVRYLGRPGGVNLLHYADTDMPLRATRSISYGSDELDWLSEYRGGWQELFPNAGAGCTVGGLPLPFHGEVSSAWWQVVESSHRHAVLRTATRLPLVLERRMRLIPDRPVLLVEETARNVGRRPVDFVWGHHPAFDARPGARLDLPGGTAAVPADHDPEGNDLRPGGTGVWPFVPSKTGGFADLRQGPEGQCERVVYLSDLPAAWAALRHPDDGVGVAMSWDLSTFPYLWLWTEVRGPDFPWYGRARILAVEPAAAWPNDGLVAARGRGQAHHLEPQEEHHTWLTVALFGADDRPVTGVARDGSADLAGDLDLGEMP